MRYFAPEVVQTSAMDCGPASLKCLLEGHGVPVSYGRLREACQTEVDGTSIDTMEEVANRLGLGVEQVMLQVDHLLRPEAGVLPALVVVRLPDGMTHFEVVWRRHGPLVQVMDPAAGRRWISARRFLDDVYVHTMPVPAAAWREWASTEAFLAPLRSRMAALGVGAAAARALADEAVQAEGWQPLAALDAATRAVEALVKAGGLGRGASARRLLDTLYRRGAAGEDGAIPESYWCTRPAPPDADGEEQVSITGAVLLRVTGRHAGEARAADLSPELAAALSEPPPRPGRTLWRMLREDGVLLPAALLAALAFAAAGVVFEALLFRGLLDVGRELGLGEQRLGAVAVVVAFLAALLAVEWPVFAGVLRLGRRLEARLRVAFLEKLPRLGDRYFQSRPLSDMADRSHSLHRLRALPELGALLARSAFELVLTTAGIVWLDPARAPVAVAAAAVALAWPLATVPVLAERDLRVQTHAGSLGRFYLDALLGLVAVRTHGAERAVRREHEGLLVEWARAALRVQRAVVGVEGVQTVLGFGLVAWLLFDHLRAGGEAGAVLLLVYWALNLPVLGQEIAQIARQYPVLRNTTLRLLEPLGALEEAPAPVADETTPDAVTSVVVMPDAVEAKAVSITFEGVRVVAGGHTILEDVDLRVPAGAHVAVVGASGAGKSSLVGLLLGWHRPAAGRLLVDGRPLTAERLDALRAATAWVDPGVYLWDESLFDNLCYAAGEAAPPAPAVEAADLRGVLMSMPEGFQTRLGEGGSRVSGGEGQRVRFGRALMQPDARLVVLDEPFRGLDREKRRRLLERARRHWRHATLLCITHDVEDTRGFERVLVVEGGRVVEDGSPLRLMERPGSRYRALLERERAVRRELWAHPGWRRWRLADGALAEHHPAAPPALPPFTKLSHLGSQSDGSALPTHVDGLRAG